MRSGQYKEQVTLKQGVNLFGNPAYPDSVRIESDQSFTVKGTIGGNYKISGVMIRNTYNGAKNYDTAALLFDLGPHAAVDHCLIETTGTADSIVGNYSSVKLTNLTLIGNAEQTANGIRLYNNNSDDVFDHLLFYRLASTVLTDHNDLRVTNSLQWKVTYPSHLLEADGNVTGDPVVAPQGFDWSYYPSLASPAIQVIMGRTKNFPGAQMPIANYY